MCDRNNPCSRCVKLGIECIVPPDVKRGRPSNRDRKLSRAQQQAARAKPEAEAVLLPVAQSQPIPSFLSEFAFAELTNDSTTSGSCEASAASTPPPELSEPPEASELPEPSHSDVEAAEADAAAIRVHGRAPTSKWPNKTCGTNFRQPKLCTRSPR